MPESDGPEKTGNTDEMETPLGFGQRAEGQEGASQVKIEKHRREREQSRWVLRVASAALEPQGVCFSRSTVYEGSTYIPGFPIALTQEMHLLTYVGQRTTL